MITRGHHFLADAHRHLRRNQALPARLARYRLGRVNFRDLETVS
jgi:hypothetical protein